MKPLFAQTDNLKRLLSGIGAVKRRAAPEACFLLVTSEPGYGKTETLRYYATQNANAIYLRAKSGWRRHWFYSDLLAELEFAPGRTTEEMAKQALARIAGQDHVLIIDEVEHALVGSEVIEAIRDVADLTEIPIVLVGMDGVKARLAKHPQIASRVARVIPFQAASTADVLEVARVKMEGTMIAADLAEEIVRQTKGRMREIVTALGAVEERGRRQKLEVVHLKDMAGESLSYDWQARTARIIAPEKA